MTIEIECAYCSLKQDEVEKLIRSHCGDIYICDKCVNVCYDQIHPKDIPYRNNDEVQIDILKETVYRAVVQGPLKHDHFIEMCQWTEETLLSYVSMNVNQRSIEFMFLKEGDAIAFKLRWL